MSKVLLAIDLRVHAYCRLLDSGREVIVNCAYALTGGTDVVGILAVGDHQRNPTDRKAATITKTCGCDVSDDAGKHVVLILLRLTHSFH